MRKKILTLGLICFFIFIQCKKQLPTSPDIPGTGSLTINYFTATPEQILFGAYSTLSWSVVNALKVEIDQGIGEVSMIGTIDVNPEETTIYTLTAYEQYSSQSKTVQITVNIDWAQSAIEIVGEPEMFYHCDDWESKQESFDFRLTIKNVSDRLITGVTLVLVIYGKDSQEAWDWLAYHHWDMGSGAGLLPSNILPGEERIVTTLGWHSIPIGTRDVPVDVCERMRDGRVEFRFKAYF